MNYIDIILLILLLLSAISGLRNGLIAEAISLATLILGIWGAIEFSYITANFLVESFSMKSEHIATVSFIVTFLIIVVLIYFVGIVMKKIVGIVLPGIINHLAGLIFGIVKSALILSVILIVFDKLDNNIHILSEDAKAKSRLHEPIRSFGPSVFPFLDAWDGR